MGNGDGRVLIHTDTCDLFIEPLLMFMILLLIVLYACHGFPSLLSMIFFCHTSCALNDREVQFCNISRPANAVSGF